MGNRLSSKIFPVTLKQANEGDSMKNPTMRRREVASSREKLIASAERLFADRGFDGVSVRDIANAAGVNSALVGYYFRGKAGLLSEVYMLHCEPLKRERARLLEEYSKGVKGPTLEQVIEAFIRPSLEVTTDKDGRTDFTRLRAVLSAENSVLLEKLVAENFDQSSRMFVNALCKCLPHLSREDVLWRFHFLLGAIYYTAAGPHRIKSLSEGRCDPSDPVVTRQHLIPYVAAGFRARRVNMTSPFVVQPRKKGANRR
jgi:AcrR family transcriptional regulator